MSAAAPLQMVRSDLPGLMIAFFVLALVAALVGLRTGADGGLRLAGLLMAGFVLLAFVVLFA